MAQRVEQPRQAHNSLQTTGGNANLAFQLLSQ